MNKYKALVFDFDGVITDGIPFHDRAYLEIFKRLGVNLDLGYMHATIGSTPRSFIKKVLLDYNLEIDKAEDLYWEFNDKTKTLYRELSVLPDDLPEFLLWLKSEKIKIAVASSTHSDIINMVLDKFNIKNYFEAIIGGEVLSNGKPDPEMIIKALKKIEVDPKQAFAIDDARSGIIAAKSIGMYAVCYSHFTGRSIAEADANVASFGQIKDLLSN